MHAARVLCSQLLGNVRQELGIDGLCDERREGGQSSAESEQNLEEGVQRVFGVFYSILSLKALSVEADVPVCGVINELQQAGNHGVETVS